MKNHEKFPSMQRFINKGNESGFYNIMALFLTLASCCSLSFFNDKAELPVVAGLKDPINNFTVIIITQRILHECLCFQFTK